MKPVFFSHLSLPTSCSTRFFDYRMDQSWRSAWRDVKSVTNRLVRGVCFEEMMSEPVEAKIPEGEGAVRVGGMRTQRQKF